MAAEAEDLERLAVEVSALGTRLDVMVQQIADVREDWRRRAQSLEVAGENRSSLVLEIASCIQAVEESIKSAVTANIKASAAELRSELCPRIEVLEAQLHASLPSIDASLLPGSSGLQAWRVRSMSAGSNASATTGSDKAACLEVPEATLRQMGFMEAEVPLLAKAIVSGAQDVNRRIMEERTLRESAEAAMEVRLVQIESEVCSRMRLASFQTQTPSRSPSLPGSPTSPQLVATRGSMTSLTHVALGGREHDHLAADNNRDEEALVPAAPPPSARLEAEASPAPCPAQQMHTRMGLAGSVTHLDAVCNAGGLTRPAHSPTISSPGGVIAGGAAAGLSLSTLGRLSESHVYSLPLRAPVRVTLPARHLAGTL